MNTLAARLLKAAGTLLLTAMAALPVRAQLNPNFYNNLRTDFLDLYQQSSSSQLVKPEIVTLLDFSGSMNQIMFDSRFPNNKDDESSAQGYQILIKIKPGNANNHNAAWVLDGVWLVKSSGDSEVTGFTGRDWSGTGDTTFTVGGTYANGNKLMRPDGAGGYTEVTSGYVESTSVTTKYTTNNQTDSIVGASDSLKSRNALNWMRAATHARMVVSWGSTSRTIDMPLSWTVLDVNSYAAAPPLKPAGGTDPYVSTYHPYDLTYINEWSNKTNWDYWTQEYSSGTYVNKACSGSSYAGWAGWRGTYLAWVFSAKSGSSYCIPGTDTAQGFGNGLRGLSRVQAVKKAVIDTWLKYQLKVYWMLRGLAPTEANTTNVNPQITSQGNSVITDNTTSGGDRSWFTLNKHKGDGLRRVAKLVADTGTPLTTSYSNTLVQFMNKTAMQDIENNEVKFLECTKHFLMVFTDGSPSGDQSPKEAAANQAYFDANGVGSRTLGNGAVKAAGISTLDIGSTYWNLPTLAGVAAHGGKISTTDTGFIVDNSNTNSPNNANSMSTYTPFFISERPGTGGGAAQKYKLSHPIQTMTIGMSLAATLDSSGNPVSIQSDTASPRYRLLAAAAAGNPIRNDWDLRSAKPYSSTDEKPTYFFDATSAEGLADALDEAMAQALALSQVSTTAMPGFPFVGSGFGSQVYLAKFDPPDSGGPVWPGDLVMFPTQKTAAGTALLDGSGNILTDNLNKATPQWSAGRVFDKDNGLGAYRTWYGRKLYTRVPGTASAKAGQLVRFRDVDVSSEGFSDFKTFLPTGGYTLAADIEAYRKKLVRFVMGADVDVSNDADQTKVPNRCEFNSTTGAFVKGVMGDIINSSPTAVEYGGMTAAKLIAGGVPADSPLISKIGDGSLKNKRFRVIFVGTNLGALHAFGEVSWEESLLVGSVYVTVTKGAVDELWAFIPSDFLPFFDYLRGSSNRHRYMVDGAPMIYHLDIAAGGTDRGGNGIIDNNDEAMVVFGLGKGGRSYYALDIRDPFTPKLGVSDGTITRGWALVPDEQVSSSVVGRMGMSTCQPMFGRVITGTTTKYLKDVVFLGGGYSTNDLDAETTTPFSGLKLGRSVLALNVLTGAVVKSWALPDTYGCVDAGVVPFEMVPNSGLAQRAYFLDHAGKLYALGKNTLWSDATYKNFLEDSSEIDQWASSARVVYKGDLTPSLNNLTSSMPAPFRITSWPLRRDDPKVSPPVVGVAWVTGDRFDPADYYPDAPSNASRPDRFRTIVVYDRNDYYLWSVAQSGVSSANLVDFSTVTASDARILPSSSTYYINPTSGTPYFGYYMNFPAKNTNGFLPKGLFSPLVFLGVMAYSYFEPSAFDPCSGGNGNTYTNRICNVILPVFPGNHTAADAQTAINGCKAGEVWSWVGVASRINLQSLTTAIQSGLSTTNSSGGTVTDPILQVKSMQGLQSERFVRPRVWRTVH